MGEKITSCRHFGSRAFSGLFRPQNYPIWDGGISSGHNWGSLGGRRGLLQKSLLKEQSLTHDNTNLKNRLRALRGVIAELRQGNFDIKESLVIAQQEQFGKSSERSTKEEIAASNNDSLRVPWANDYDKTNAPKKRILRPSERYPNAEIRETHVTSETPPKCPCCSEEMQDSGLTEESERLSIIPKQFIIDRQIRHKFRCSNCQGSIVTAAALPSITPGGAFK
ncbi:MAG: IS66 family transposase zinc-finger binding domain-containing protein [Bdellovibrionota bacterium]